MGPLIAFALIVFGMVCAESLQETLDSRSCEKAGGVMVDSKCIEYKEIKYGE